MNDFSNGRHYERRFADPRIRPSNQRVDPVVEATRQSVEQVGRFIDDLEAERDGEAVAEAWRVLHPARPRMRFGDPGE
jgi:hypothetical protein